ncbi:MAG: hypothetical protein JWP97_934 [Labilithrix sp.]|nr:hypothetical protein [Labilithrix sp.]
MARAPALPALIALACSLGALACDQPAYVRILDTRLSRDAQNHVVAEVELEAAEQGGGNVGPYCVSIHYFALGVVQTTALQTYPGELEAVELCASDLSDGDQRFVRLVSTRGDLGPGLPARVQVRRGRDFEIHEGVFTP